MRAGFEYTPAEGERPLPFGAGVVSWGGWGFPIADRWGFYY
jgi:hypothetical protein